MSDRGDCPGLTVPRVKLLSELTKGLGCDLEVLHFGTWSGRHRRLVSWA